jgi:hypothetical protein
MNQIEITRPVYNRTKFDEQYKQISTVENSSISRNLKILLKFFKLFTPLPWFSGYNFKKQFVKDLISGLTVGIMHIPQGTFTFTIGLIPIDIKMFIQFLRSRLWFPNVTSSDLWPLLIILSRYTSWWSLI